MLTVIDMTENELAAELMRLEVLWDEVNADLVESGGMAGSPGEWIIERMDEIRTEQMQRGKCR